MKANVQFAKLILCVMALATLPATAELTRSHPTKSSDLISVDAFRKLSRAKKEIYFSSVYKILAELHRDRELEFASDELMKSLARMPAADSDAKCLIGGVLRTKLRDKCPTSGRYCEFQDANQTKQAGFRCGIVYGYACVSTENKNRISELCNLAATDQFLKNKLAEEEFVRLYEAKKLQIEEIAQGFCGSNAAKGNLQNCANFHAKNQSLIAFVSQSSTPPVAAQRPRLPGPPKNISGPIAPQDLFPDAEPVAKPGAVAPEVRGITEDQFLSQTSSSDLIQPQAGTPCTSGRDWWGNPTANCQLQPQTRSVSGTD